MEETICEVEMEAIRVSPFQPRRTFSEEELEELAASIRTVGLIHPPVVRPVMNASGGVLYYELIAGERRWRAARIAGLDKLKVIVRPSSDEHAAQTSLIENIQRINLDPIEMGLAFKKLIDVFRMSQEEVAEKVGKKRSTVANYLRLLTLPENIKQHVSSGEISMGHAKAILSIGNPQERFNLSERIIEEKMNVRDAERASRKLQHKQEQSEEAEDFSIEELEANLQNAFGVKVTIDHTKKGGKIILHYDGMDTLDRLLVALLLSEDS